MSKITIERSFEWCNQSFTNIYINDENFGKINSGKNIELEVSPGRHKVAVKRSMLLQNKPIMVDIGKDQNKIVRVVSYKYSRVTWPILLLFLFSIYQLAANVYDLEKYLIVVIVVYAVFIYLFMSFLFQGFF